MFPVFSLVLDQDVKPEMALLYPELYKDLTKGRSLSFKTFLIWVLVSVYQGNMKFLISIPPPPPSLKVTIRQSVSQWLKFPALSAGTMRV